MRLRVPAIEIARIPELAYNRLGLRVACALANVFFEEGPDFPDNNPLSPANRHKAAAGAAAATSPSGFTTATATASPSSGAAATGASPGLVASSSAAILPEEALGNLDFALGASPSSFSSSSSSAGVGAAPQNQHRPSVSHHSSPSHPTHNANTAATDAMVVSPSGASPGPLVSSQSAGSTAFMTSFSSPVYGGDHRVLPRTGTAALAAPVTAIESIRATIYTRTYDFLDFLRLLFVFHHQTPTAFKAWAAFRVYDFNENNEVDITDVQAMLLFIMGKRALSDKLVVLASKTMDEIDVDGNKTISVFEFEQFLKRVPEFSYNFSFEPVTIEESLRFRFDPALLPRVSNDHHSTHANARDRGTSNAVSPSPSPTAAAAAAAAATATAAANNANSDPEGAGAGAGSGERKRVSFAATHEERPIPSHGAYNGEGGAVIPGGAQSFEAPGQGYAGLPTLPEGSVSGSNDNGEYNNAAAAAHAAAGSEYHGDGSFAQSYGQAPGGYAASSHCIGPSSQVDGYAGAGESYSHAGAHGHQYESMDGSSSSGGRGGGDVAAGSFTAVHGDGSVLGLGDERAGSFAYDNAAEMNNNGNGTTNFVSDNSNYVHNTGAGVGNFGNAGDAEGEYEYEQQPFAPVKGYEAYPGPAPEDGNTN